MALRRKLVTVTPGTACGILEREEEAALRTLVRAERHEVLAAEENLALGDLVRGMSHQRVGERRLSRAVRAHDRVDLVLVHSEVDALDDLRSVLERDVQIVDLEQCHCESESGLTKPFFGGVRDPV
jgi:hypothetical protein